MKRGFFLTKGDNEKGDGETNNKKNVRRTSVRPSEQEERQKNVSPPISPPISKARQLTYTFEVWHLTCVISHGLSLSSTPEMLNV